METAVQFCYGLLSKRDCLLENQSGRECMGLLNDDLARVGTTGRRTSPLTFNILRVDAVVATKSHNLRVSGANPLPATIRWLQIVT